MNDIDVFTFLSTITAQHRISLHHWQDCWPNPFLFYSF